MRRLLLAVSSGLLLVPLTALAVSYTDVPKNSRYIDAITALSDAGVLTGNPDGTFRPTYPINRAAILKMSYKAANLEPSPTAPHTFSKDVPVDSWFAPYVWDATERKFVSGYTDGTFRPSTMVTVAESLKIMMEVLGIPAPKVTTEDVNILPFDVSPYAWYAPYVVEATRLKVLPLPDQGIEFYLNDPLERQQAAEMLYRLWKVWQSNQGTSSSSSSSVSSSSVSSMSEQSSSRSSSRASMSYNRAEPDIRTVSFPMKDQWQFSGKQAMLYRFSMDKKAVIDVRASVRNDQKGTISCRLYHLQDDGTALEYYVGVESGQTCQILAAITPGNYQLELNSAVENAAFTVSTAAGTGDGNDGLSQAQTLVAGQIRQGLLAANDLEDWFVFIIPTTAPEGGAPFVVSTTADGDLGCEIQPGANVNVFGFANPACNLSTLFTSGTYYVRLKHLPPTAGKRTYTIMLKAQ